MTETEDQLIQDSGNVWRDFGYPDADIRQAKASSPPGSSALSRIGSCRPARPPS